MLYVKSAEHRKNMKSKAATANIEIRVPGGMAGVQVFMRTPQEEEDREAGKSMRFWKHSLGYSRATFNGLEAGDYLLVVPTHNFRKEVTLLPGFNAEVRLGYPPLAQEKEREL